MKIPRFANSIVTRLIVFGIVIAVATSTARYFLLSNFLREDLEKVVSSQQEALAGYVARDIDFKIIERQRMLRQLAATLPLRLLEKPDQLRAWLRQHHDFQPLFSQGLFVANAKGIAIADYPVLPHRTGTNYADRDYIRAAIAGEMTIGRPVMGRVANEPIVPMATPIMDSSGKVRAVLAGITATAAPGFFDLLQQIHIGETGGFLLISPREQIFVAATKPELILKPTAPPGVNLLHDRALGGWRGSGITVNAQGVEEIAAFASVPSTGWFVVARLPTVEAFATVKRTQIYILRNAIVIICIFLVILAIGLTIILRPLSRAAKHAELMTLGEIPLAPLPIESADEVGHLTGAFNRLLGKLLTSQAELVQTSRQDALTGLPNRLLLSDRMNQALARSKRNQTGLAVLFLDLDGFKTINDRLGHEAGDNALIQVTQRLSAIMREEDTLARVGGDEFVVVISDLDPLAERAELAACAVAKKCVEAISSPMTIKGEQLTVGISIGIAMGDGKSSFDELLSIADSAMYKAKETGRGRYVLASHNDEIASCLVAT
jgi:diguanylate cyclase (GGDEF)-like protein